MNWEAKSHETNCLYRLFEYNRFLCMHILCVIQSLFVFNIPTHYILKQWSDDAKRLDYTSSTSNNSEGKKQHFNKLFH